MELLPGDANGAGSETLSTYTALGADVRKLLLTSIFGLTLVDLETILEKLIFTLRVTAACLLLGSSHQSHQGEQKKNYMNRFKHKLVWAE